MFTILDLGKELKKLDNFDKDEYIAKLEKEVARFIRNADLNVINHQKMYAELRAAKHTLWMARAYNGFNTTYNLTSYHNYMIEHPDTKVTPRRWYHGWKTVERKCLEKAKEFE